MFAGGGGAPLYGVKDTWWAAVSESAYHYVVVNVEAVSLRMVVKKPGGETIDDFKLEKVLFEELK